jgi:hypothetical protein
MSDPSSDWPKVATPGASSPVYDNAPDNPAALADAVHAFLKRFIAYPDEHSSIAHVLWIATAHLVECFDNTPRLAFLSPEPASGKSRALELTEVLVPRPASTVNASPSYIFRKISDPEGLPTLLIDEADAIFSPKKADGNEDLRALVNAGYRKGNNAGRVTIRGRELVAEEWPSFCAVALAGLHELPDTIMTRSVVIRMKRRRADQQVSQYRRRLTVTESEALRERLALFAESQRETIGDVFPELPEGIEDRDADLWESLITVADQLGGSWPQLARETAVTMVANGKEKSPTLGIRLLADIWEVFGSRDRISTADLLEGLHAIETAPWGSLRGEPIDAKYLARALDKYGIKAGRTVRFPETVLKGYHRADFFDAWSRYTPHLQQESTGPKCRLCSSVLHPITVSEGFDTCPSCMPVTPLTGVTLPSGRETL